MRKLFLVITLVAVACKSRSFNSETKTTSRPTGNCYSSVGLAMEELVDANNAQSRDVMSRVFADCESGMTESAKVYSQVLRKSCSDAYSGTSLRAGGGSAYGQASLSCQLDAVLMAYSQFMIAQSISSSNTTSR